MSLISRVTAPAASHDTAGLVRALLSAGTSPPTAGPAPPPTALPLPLPTPAAAHRPTAAPLPEWAPHPPTAVPTSPTSSEAHLAEAVKPPEVVLSSEEPRPSEAGKPPTAGRAPAAGNAPAVGNAPTVWRAPAVRNAPTELHASVAGAPSGAGHSPSVGNPLAAGDVPGGVAPPTETSLPGDAHRPVPAQLPTGPTGLGTSAAALARVGLGASAVESARTGPGVSAAALARVGLGASAVESARTGSGAPAAAPVGAGRDTSAVGRGGGAASEPRREASAPAVDPGRRLHCPPAVRDDPALGETVTERLVRWAEETGICAGRLDKIRTADLGRLVMLAHPESDDPDRLLAAAKCALSEWAVGDHHLDGEAEEARPAEPGQRLAVARSVIDQSHLPLGYAPGSKRAVTADPVMRALRDSLRNLHTYATMSQVRRLRHELGIMLNAFDQEADWQASGHVPSAGEFLTHRHENSFVPGMVLVDTIAGYEVPYGEFSDPRVRRAFTMAGTAGMLVNDLYSMAKEDPADFSLPRLIASEEGCSPAEAVDRTVDIHNELMLTFEAEAAALARTGSPELCRFLAGTWTWAGGSREWHASSGRRREDASPESASHEPAQAA
ncbi:family 2 encapsulin nanocompartment cargo protein terpene cyclase [Streptomyces sp. CG1]|uniref:family 2 encapsulin nanocompartment cargo protein terpene cyclase n=1 Tax=Streptomyces sp. CG1 TaxID=1287523 RepID=UPI0034E1FC51